MTRLVIVGVTALADFIGDTRYSGNQRVHVKTVPVTRGHARLTVSTMFNGIGGV